MKTIRDYTEKITALTPEERHRWGQSQHLSPEDLVNSVRSAWKEIVSEFGREVAMAQSQEVVTAMGLNMPFAWLVEYILEEEDEVVALRRFVASGGARRMNMAL